MNFEAPSQCNNGGSVINHHYDDPGMMITTTMLTEKNYLVWSWTMKLSLGALDRLSFIDGTSPKPELGSEDYDKWNQRNSVVWSWIINSISESLKEQFMFVESAKELWDEIAQRYGCYTGRMAYDLFREINLLQQGSLSVVAYYSKLRRLWAERDAWSPFPVCKCEPKCICGVYSKLCEREEVDKLMKFLLGLDGNYEGVKDQILLMDPLPTVDRAYSLIFSAEKKLGLTGYNSEQMSTSSAMMARNDHNDNRRNFDRAKKNTMRCDYCSRRGHVKESCFELRGFPDWWEKKNQKGKRNNYVKSTAAYIAETPLEGAGEGKGSMKGLVSTFMRLQQDLEKLTCNSGTGQDNGKCAYLEDYHDFAGPVF